MEPTSADRTALPSGGLELLQRAAAEATSMGLERVTTIHLLLALTASGSARDWLLSVAVDVDGLRRSAVVADGSRATDALPVVATAWHRAREVDAAPRLLDLRVLLEITEGPDVAASLLSEFGVSADMMRRAVDSGAAAEVLAHEDIINALTPVSDEHRVAEIVASVCGTSAPIGSAGLRSVHVQRRSDSAEVELRTSTPGRLLGELGGGLDAIATSVENALGLQHVRVRVVDDRSS